MRALVLMAAVAAAVVAGCGAKVDPASPADFEELDELELELAGRSPARHALAGYEGSFLLSWNGARVGSASEYLRPQGDGLRFVRREQIAVRRGGATVESETRIVIEIDPPTRAGRGDALHASAIRLEQESGGVVRRGEAVRDPDGRWRIELDGEATRTAPEDAVPAELVPFLAASRGRWNGPVLLAGWGFAGGELEVTPLLGAGADDRDDGPPRGLELMLRTDAGLLGGQVLLGESGTPSRIVSGDTVARRVDAADLDEDFTPPEVVDGTSLAVAGMSDEPDKRRAVRSLRLGPVQRALPPAIPGQRVTAAGETWHVDLEAGGDARGAAMREVADLVRATADLLDEDLGADATTGEDALALGRGDCTAHAVLFAEMAAKKGLDVRLVTGYRLDDAKLVRHRWAVVRVGEAWVSVDPTFNEAPSAPRLLGLATHGWSAADLALASEVAFAGLGDTRVRAGR